MLTLIADKIVPNGSALIAACVHVDIDSTWIDTVLDEVLSVLHLLLMLKEGYI